MEAFGQSNRPSINRKAALNSKLDRASALLEDIAALIRAFPALEAMLKRLGLYAQAAPYGCGTRWPYYMVAAMWLLDHEPPTKVG